jgi:hypothetical protein
MLPRIRPTVGEAHQNAVLAVPGEPAVLLGRTEPRREEPSGILAE